MAFTTQQITCILVSLCLAFYKSWQLTFVSLAGIPIAVTIGALTARPITSNLDTNKKYFEKASDTMHWTASSMTTIKLFNSQQIHLKNFDKDVTKAYKFYVRFANFMALQRGLSRFLVLTMFVQGFYFGNHLVQNGKVSSGDVMTVFWSCINVASNFNALSPQLVLLRKGQAAVKSLLGLTETAWEAAVKFRQGIGLYPMNECDSIAGEIMLKDVNFSYPSRAGRVLKSFNMHIKPNQMTFIVGQSGSGKSTLSSILLKLYEIESGSVFIDNTSLETISSKWLFDNIHVVEQQAAMFDVTLAENIRMGAGDPDAVTKDDLQIACKFGLLTDFINRLDTNAGAGGELLSGGQRQRVALARAYLARHVPIMIFDESVSALDEKLRLKAMNSIREFRNRDDGSRKRKTTIVITHELSQIDMDDYVYLVHDGRVEQNGTRRELEKDGNEGNHWQWMIEATEAYSKLGENDEKKKKDETIPRHTVHSLHARSSILRPVSVIGTYEPHEAHPVHEPQQSTDPEKKIEHDKLPIIKLLKNVYTTIPNKILLLVGITITCTNGIINPLFSYAFSNLFTTIVPNTDDQAKVTQWAMVVLGLAAADGLTTYLRIVLETTAEKWIYSLRKSYFTKLVSMDMPWHMASSTFSASESTQLAMSDTEAMRQLVSKLLSAVINIIVLVLFAVIWSLTSGWKLSLVGLSLLPGFFLTSQWYTKVSTKWESKAQQNADDMVLLMNEILASIKTVKVLALERYFVKQYNKLEKQAMDIGFRKAVYVGLGFGMAQVFTYITQGLLLWYGMKLISVGEYQVQQTMMIFTLLVFSMVTADQIFSTIPQVTQGINAFTKLYEFLNQQFESQEAQGDDELPSTSKSAAVIDFHKVSFSYTTQKILSNFSLTIYPFECISLIGASGSGKSTVASLLTRLYHPQSGIISINGQNILNLNINTIRQYVTIVHQMPLKFLPTGSSIRQNLEYAWGEFPLHPARREPEFEKVLHQVGLWQFISSLDDGLDTPIGSGLMSGGQLQRLGIARALLRNPSILILDECTSALDPQSMAMVQKLVVNLKSKRLCTIMIITHQQEMMNIADRCISVS